MGSCRQENGQNGGLEQWQVGCRLRSQDWEGNLAQTSWPSQPFKCLKYPKIQRLHSEVLSESAIEQRLRRASTAGKKKGAAGGEAAVQLYKDVDNREAMTKMLIAAGFSKAPW